MIGRTLGRYRITEEIGHGGMGVVYRAHDTRLGREVALKVLAPGPSEDPDLQRRLRQEAQAAASLAHPAICVIHEIDEADGATFIAMELVRGFPLATLVKTRLPPARALELALEIVEGLTEAHARGVVHRDLKPSNVMVTDSGHAKIIDFGLAKVFRPIDPVTSDTDTPMRGQTDPGRIIGTAAYMSPEQVRGATVDPRSDLFSFGGMLFEMLAGAPAFRRETGVETLHAVLKEAAPRLPDAGLGAAHADLVRILDKCLAKDPRDRYASAADLLVDLRMAKRRLDEKDASPARGMEAPAPTSTAVQPAVAGPLRVVVVDDEDPARAILKEYLSKEPDVELVGECRNGFEAVKTVSEVKPDLVFLDVQMPKLTGFEVLELIGSDHAVVFVTAFDEHAVKAFEVNAVDYLLKPVGADRFRAALARARERVRIKAPLPVSVPQLLQAARPEGATIERILVRHGAKVQVIPVPELDYAEAQDDYVGLHSGGKEYLKQQTLTELEKTLDPARFVRIHRSYLLNLDRLQRLEGDGGDGRVAVLKSGARLPVSRAGFARLKTFL
jgi:two-component system, LytTR family, response regulator